MKKIFGFVIMKEEEFEKRMEIEYNEGYDKAVAEEGSRQYRYGYDDGYSVGCDDGYSEGYSEGYDKGEDHGYGVGYNTGYHSASEGEG